MMVSIRAGFVPWSPGILCLLSMLVAAVPARSADLDYPLSIAVSEQGVIYLADRNLPGVWKIENSKLSLVFEGSKRFRTPLNAIRCVTLDRDGRVLAGDSSTRDVYRLNEQGQPVGLTQSATAAAPAPSPAPASPAAPATETKGGDTPPAQASPAPSGSTPSGPAKFVFGQIGIPMDIAVDAAGDLYVSDLETHRIVKVAKAGGPAHEFVAIQAPRGLCMDGEQHLWVVSGRTLVRISPAGEKKTIVEEGTLNFPHTVAVAGDLTAFVCDGYEKCIWKIPAGGKPEKLLGGEPFQNPVGMRLVGDKLYIVDPRAKSVFQVTLDGKLTKITWEAASPGK